MVLRAPENWQSESNSFIEVHDTLILADHGAVSMGASLDEAQSHMETLEHSTKIVFTVRLFGRVNHLSWDEVRRLEGLRRNRNRSQGLLDSPAPGHRKPPKES